MADNFGEAFRDAKVGALTQGIIGQNYLYLIM